jgi:nicotinate-nucleotide pyrophosphorylase (carboxylating)
MNKVFENDAVIKFLETCLKEDVGYSDITTEAIVNEEMCSKSKIISKDNGIIAGIDVATVLFELVDEDIETVAHFADGDEVKRGDEILSINGRIQSILMAERVVLNFMQRMSAIATNTRRFVEEIKGTKAKIFDTRKTAPGLRYFDKYSVKIGGAENHRKGLYDMFLIKENHIVAAGGISKAIEECFNHKIDEGLDCKIEIEVKNIDELKETLLSDKVDLILLDNFSVEKINEAVQLVNGKIELEASGGVTFENLRKIAETGVDRISIGALTNSVKAFDLSLLILKD